MPRLTNHDRPALLSRRLPCLAACLWLTAPPLAAQDGTGEKAGDDPSRETDISEDNYRRFMELDDSQLERPAFPAASVAPATRLQKMGQLPEESQKHLRNQLRGIILQRGPWTPAERETDYPFVPSPAARRDGELMRQEAEAWTELVGEYHDREAAILADRDGEAAAAAAISARNGHALQPPDGPDGAGGNPQAAQTGATGGKPGAGPESGTGNGADSGKGEDEDGSADESGRQAANGSEGGREGTGDQAGEETGDQARERDPRVRHAAPEWTDQEDPAVQAAPSTDGSEQSAAAFLRQQGLTSGESPIDTPPPDAADPEQDPGRWGAAANTVLPPADGDVDGGEREEVPVGIVEAEDTDVGSGGLTLEELRRVRGLERAPEPSPNFGPEPPEDDPTAVDAPGDPEADRRDAPNAHDDSPSPVPDDDD